MKKLPRIITILILAIAILLTVSCDHNVYMYDNTDNMWYVNGSFFSSMQAAFDYIYQMVMGSRSIDDVPAERTAILLRDVKDGERGGGLRVPADFTGMLKIDFGGHTYEFDDSLDHFFEILGGDEVYITNGTTVIYNEASHIPYAVAVNTDTLTIDAHLIDDRRVDPTDSTRSDAKLFDVGEKGSLVVRNVPELEGASLNGVISVVTDGTTGGRLSLNDSRIIITNILTRYKDAQGEIHDSIPAETAIPADARSVIDILSGYVTILDINTPSDYRNGATLYEKAILNIIKGNPDKDTKVDNPHNIDAIIETIINLPASAGVEHAVIHEYAPEWRTDPHFHWHECTICGHKDDDYGEHAFTEWEEDPETLDWIRHCTVCELEQRESHVHTLSHVDPKEPTCTEDGNLEHWVCTHPGCGRIFLDWDAREEATVEQITVSATGHSWNAEWSIDAEHHWHDCLNGCGEKADEAEHSFSDWTYDSSDDKDHRDCGICCHEESRDHVHSLAHTEAKDETCTEDGNIEFWYCSICGRYYSDEACTDQITEDDTVIPAKGHSWSTEWSHDEEHHWHDCLNGCGEKADEAEHTFSDWTYDNTDDKDHRDCGICGREETRDHVHSLTHVKAKAETCTEDGNIEYWYCDICDRYYRDKACTEQVTEEGTVIPKTGHSWNEGWIYDDAHHWHVCDNNCGEINGEEEHTWSDWGYDEELEKLVRTCNVCGAKDIEDHEHSSDTWVTTDPINHWKLCSCGTTFDSEAHSFTDWTYDPDLDKDTRGCTVCGRTETRDHVHGTVADGTLIHTDGYAATCTEEGLKEHWYCTLCERYYLDVSCDEDSETTEEGTVIPALGHDMGDWAVTTDPTCTEKGEETRYCSRCDHTETRDVAALGHDAVHHDRVDPTCIETGLEEHWECSRCHELFLDEDCTEEVDYEDLVIPVGDHVPGEWVVDGDIHYRICSACGNRIDEGEHIIGDWVQTENTHYHECEVCNVHLDYGEHVWDGGHLCEDGQHVVYTCTVCGKKRNASEPEYEEYHLSIGTILIPAMPTAACGDMVVTQNGNDVKVEFVPHENSNTDYTLNCRYLRNGKWSGSLTQDSDGSFHFTMSGKMAYKIVLQIITEGGTITREESVKPQV